MAKLRARAARAKRPRQRESASRELGQPARDTTDTVGTFALEWITTALAASERKASTKAMYATLTRNHIASSALGGMPLGKATPRAVEGWLVAFEPEAGRVHGTH